MYFPESLCEWGLCEPNCGSFIIALAKKIFISHLTQTPTDIYVLYRPICRCLHSLIKTDVQNLIFKYILNKEKTKHLYKCYSQFHIFVQYCKYCKRG